MSRSLCESYAHLYIGDYFADTLHLSEQEHRAFRLLLLHIWTHGSLQEDDAALADIAGLTFEDLKTIKRAIFPLVAGAATRHGARTPGR